MELIPLAELLLEEMIFGDRVVVGEGALHAEPEAFELEGFLQVIERALLHRLDRRLHRAERGDDDDDGGRMERTGFAQNVQTLLAAGIEMEIGDDKIGVVFLQCIVGRVALIERKHLVPAGSKQLADRLDHRHLIIDHEDLGHGEDIR